MKTETGLDAREALKRGAALPWALVRELSRVSLGPTPIDVDAEEVLEACFFSPQEEVRLWREDGQLRAAALTDEEGDLTLEERYSVDNPDFGQELWVRRYIGFDEDGQAFIAASRLCGWEGGKENG